MSTIEKLAELIGKAKRSMWGKNGLSSDLARNTYIAEYLIGNGVIDLVKEAAEADGATDTNDGHKSEWISVGERLPEKQGAYLVFTCDRRISMCHFIDHYCDGNMQFDDYRVTHWMPLPEAPKMKGGAE